MGEESSMAVTPAPSVATMTINITVDSYKHIQSVLDGMVMGPPPPNGAIQGRPAPVIINPKVRELVTALYHVLSGGQVTPTAGAWPPTTASPGTLTVRTGIQNSVDDLQKMEDACLASINVVNGALNLE